MTNGWHWSVTMVRASMPSEFADSFWIRKFEHHPSCKIATRSESVIHWARHKASSTSATRLCLITDFRRPRGPWGHGLGSFSSSPRPTRRNRELRTNVVITTMGRFRSLLQVRFLCNMTLRKKHHQTLSCYNELLAILKGNCVKYGPRYLD